MDDKRNLITAILLSALILIGWTFVSEKFFPTPDTPDVTTTVAGTATPVTANADGTLPPPAAAGATPVAAPVEGAANVIRPLATALAASARVPIETPKLKGSINLTGARIDDLTLTRYRQTIDKGSPAVRLFSPGGTKGAYFAGVGWTGAGVELPTAKTVWTATGTKLTPTTPVSLRWSNATGQTFGIDYSIDANYLVTAKQSVSNTGAAAVSVAPYSYVNRVGKPTDPHEADSYTIHIGPMGVFDGAANYDINYDTLLESPSKSTSFKTTGGWIGFTDKYWLAAVIPSPKAAVNAEMRVADGQLFQSNFTQNAMSVAPGKALAVTSNIFAGAKETNVLVDYQDRLGIAQLDRAIDWGWFYWFEKPIFNLLDWLFNLFGNFGVAIIGLTVIIRALMFPIAQKQFHSMAQMRVVQPKMKALQDKHKDDKPKMQQELMKLYKEEKINPLAGCLPILLQIPIFYALYKVLMLTIEMRHQPFALWIKDLSAPDPATFLNLFGLLDFTPPSLLSIGVLALILGITMFLQFRLNPAPADPIQAQVFSIMPWMMMFVMAPFAAGLLLYWVTNNLLSIGQQQFLYSRYPAMKQAMAADKLAAAANKAKSG